MSAIPRRSQSVHLRVPADLLEQIDSIAVSRQVSRSRLLMDAARKQLNIPPPRPANVFDDIG